MFQFLRKNRSAEKALVREENTRAISEIMSKLEKRIEQIDKFIMRGETVLYVRIGKSETETVLKSVRSLIQKTDCTPVWTDIRVTVKGSMYKIHVNAF